MESKIKDDNMKQVAKDNVSVISFFQNGNFTFSLTTLPKYDVSFVQKIKCLET